MECRQKKRCLGDHPRLCGEKVSASGVFSPFNGSPPPMRGKVALLAVLFFRIRITPAYAGKRSLSMTKWNLKWDHPRLCGEKEVLRVEDTETEGSPPPMRGKVLHFVQSTQRNRITPAYAGKNGFGLFPNL